MLSTNATHLATTRSGELLIPGSAWIDVGPAEAGGYGDRSDPGRAEGTRNLMRSSQIGFTALEIIYLLRWVENPGFPGWVDVVKPSCMGHGLGERLRDCPGAAPGRRCRRRPRFPRRSGRGQAPLRSEAPRPTGAVPRVDAAGGAGPGGPERARAFTETLRIAARTIPSTFHAKTGRQHRSHRDPAGGAVSRTGVGRTRSGGGGIGVRARRCTRHHGASAGGSGTSGP